MHRAINNKRHQRAAARTARQRHHARALFVIAGLRAPRAHLASRINA